MDRNVQVTVDTASWPSGGVPAAIAALAGNRALDMLFALVHTALWTRPPRIYGFDLSDCWAWMRYAPAISANPDLQLRQEWTGLDPHHKTILSDELGVGATTYLLTDPLKCVEFVSTGYAVASVFPGQFRPVKKSKRGPSKTPDYIARLSNGRFAVLECKGTQTSPKVLRDALADGRTQKQNLAAQPGTKISHSLVAGLFIPQARSRKKAEILIADPEGSELASLLKEASTEALTLATVQMAVAQQFALAGLWDIANVLATPSVRELSEVRTALSRLFEGRRTTSVDHAIPFTTDKESDRLETLRFHFDVGPLVKSLQVASPLVQALGAIADESARMEWIHRSNEDGKSVVVRTPYRTEISLAIMEQERLGA